MSCPANKPYEIRICAQNKEVADGLRKSLESSTVAKKMIRVLPSSSKKKSTKKIKIKKSTKKIKIKKSTKKIKIKKSTKKITIKKSDKKHKKCKKRCPYGSHCNYKTGRCKKTQKKKKTPKKKQHTQIDVIKNTTPSLNKELKLMTSPSVKKTVTQSDPFSPSVNKAIMSLRQLSPHLDVFDCVKNREIKVQTSKGSKCVGWKTKKAQETMLDNLLSKKKIIASHIIAPKQSLSNCWFNTFFMTFFISDKGRKFNRALREMMITGNLIKHNKPSQKITKQLQWPFFLLNKYIEASLRGSDDPSRFAELMDTNTLIRQIYNATKRLKGKSGNYPTIAKTRQASNPLTFYNAMMYYLYDAGENPIWNREFSNDDWTTTIRPNLEKGGKYGEAPHILYILYSDNYANIGKKAPLSFSFTIKQKGGNRVAKYKLDAAILRDIDRKHFSAYLTINGKEYGFDGESFSRIEPFKWKKKVFKNTRWRFAEQYNTYFNFAKGYQILIYYRTT